MAGVEDNTYTPHNRYKQAFIEFCLSCILILQFCVYSNVYRTLIFNNIHNLSSENEFVIKSTILLFVIITFPKKDLFQL